MIPQYYHRLSSTTCSYLWLILVLILVHGVELAKAQEEAVCYGPGSIAASVILSIIFTALVLAGLYYLWKKFRKPRELILQTDPEKGKGEYAFDNPGFKDPGLTPISKLSEKSNKLDPTKAKWNQWTPLSAFTTRSEKRKTMDDSAIDGNEVKVVALRSHDFTGLGFNICGNMKDGIFIKDVLHRGPASESGKLTAGDRINSVTISFEHIVYEDALAILSYASPYEIIVEARRGRIFHNYSNQGTYPSHPIYRSSSSTDLLQNSTRRKLFEDGSLSSNYSSLQKSRSNMTTLERKESKSPQVGQNIHKKPVAKTQLSPGQLKSQLEQKILSDHQNNLKIKNEKLNREEAEVQKTENKFQKFGIRVLPLERSPKSAEQNENNVNLEKQPIGIDEVDKKPQVKKREKKPDLTPEKNDENFDRSTVIYGSGIKRDINGIPQEIPNYLMSAAVAARTNRKSSDDRDKSKDEEVERTPKKTKGKAPAPPDEKLKEVEKSCSDNFDEIHSIYDDVEVILLKSAKGETDDDELEVEMRVKDEIKDYNSDSDLENDNQSSVNTIELNSSDITVHQENEDRQNRRTASTGDLTKIQKTQKSNTGTLERAQSLDITDTGIPTLSKKRKNSRMEDEMKSDEDIFGKVMMSKEPRLSLILDGLNTFQRNRLKKSTEWGNLEDAILKLNQEDENSTFDENITLEEIKFDFGTKSEEFDALVNKINEIKRESLDLGNVEQNGLPPEKKLKNQIWPSFQFENPEKLTNGSIETPLNGDPKFKEDKPRLISVDKRQRKPSEETIDKNIKPAVPEKREFLLSTPRRVNSPPVPTRDENSSKVWERQLPPDSVNKSDEVKTNAVLPVNDVFYLNVVDLTKNFIFTEKISCSQDEDHFKADDTNISDDLKVSRHSLGSLERPKSDDAKMNISNITVNNVLARNDESLNLEINMDEPSNIDDTSEFYTTAMDKTLKVDNDTSKIIITTPDIIKNVTITEAINNLNNDVVIQGPSSLTLELPNEMLTENNKVSLGVKGEEINENEQENNSRDGSPDSLNNLNSLTYVTEIQVLTPNSKPSNGVNVSEIKIIPNVNSNDRNLDNEFEDYVKNFESNVKNFESKIQKFEQTFESNKNEVKNTSEDSIDAEKEAHKIQEIAEEQLKKLPEMRFSTSSYESPKSPTDNKRQSQIELLRSNFEKSPSKATKSETPSKSRIPIATTSKTPPTSPERRDSRNLDMENDKAILELMSSSVHSTPLAPKHQVKSPNKNVTVTSIRSNSKIPSGLPVLSSASRPPIPPKKHDVEDHSVQISTNGVESSFKQWVFNPFDQSVTNILVSESKPQK